MPVLLNAIGQLVLLRRVRTCAPDGGSPQIIRSCSIAIVYPKWRSFSTKMAALSCGRASQGRPAPVFGPGPRAESVFSAKNGTVSQEPGVSSHLVPALFPSTLKRWDETRAAIHDTRTARTQPAGTPEVAERFYCAGGSPPNWPARATTSATRRPSCSSSTACISRTTATAASSWASRADERSQGLQLDGADGRARRPAPRRSVAGRSWTCATRWATARCESPAGRTCKSTAWRSANLVRDAAPSSTRRA